MSFKTEQSNAIFLSLCFVLPVWPVVFLTRFPRERAGRKLWLSVSKGCLTFHSGVQVQTKDNKLTIAGKRERSSQSQEGDNSSKQRYERTFGKFSRQLRLPEDADSNNIKAKVDDGVLTVTISKLEKLPGVGEVQVDF